MVFRHPVCIYVDKRTLHMYVQYSVCTPTIYMYIYVQINLSTYVHDICIWICLAYAYQYGTWCTALRSLQRRDKRYKCIYNTCVYTYIIHMQINIYRYIHRIRVYIYKAYAHQYGTSRSTLPSVHTRDKHDKCIYNTCVYTHTFHMQINIHTCLQGICIHICSAYAYEYETWCTALRSVQ